MSTLEADLQRGVFTLLEGNINIPGYGSIPVFDAVPKSSDNENTPRYVTIGDTFVNSFDTKLDNTKDNKKAILTIHCWTKDYEGRIAVKEITDAVETLMNRGNLVVPNYDVILIRAIDSQSVRDPDGNTYHSIKTYDIILNDAT